MEKQTMIRYKLFDQKLRAKYSDVYHSIYFDQFQLWLWQEPIPNESDYCFSDPIFTILHGPWFVSHDDLCASQLWKIEVKEKSEISKFSERWSKMRLIEKINIPDIHTIQRLEYALLCALDVYDINSYGSDIHIWAYEWLEKIDRSRDSAEKAYKIINKLLKTRNTRAVKSMKCAIEAIFDDICTGNQLQVLKNTTKAAFLALKCKTTIDLNKIAYSLSKPW